MRAHLDWLKPGLGERRLKGLETLVSQTAPCASKSRRPGELVTTIDPFFWYGRDAELYTPSAGQLRIFRLTSNESENYHISQSRQGRSCRCLQLKGRVNIGSGVRFGACQAILWGDGLTLKVLVN